MKVFINDREIHLFRGATLKHALLKANEGYFHAVKNGLAEIRDQEGNFIDIRGAVAEGWRYYIIYKGSKGSE